MVSESYGTKLLGKLLYQGKRVFTMEDAREVAQAENIPERQLAIILSNLVKQQKIERLRRGLYASLGLLGEKPHPFVVSAFLVQPSAISHWTALQHHGLTEQIPNIITASTPKKVVTPSMREQKRQESSHKHAWVIDGVRYEYIFLKHLFGIELVWIDEHSQVAITDKERTLLDVFISPKMFGGIGEALGILENSLSEIDIEKLVTYALKYNKASVIKRLGWALDYFGISPEQLESLRNFSISYYCRLDPEKPAEGSYDKDWMIQNNLVLKGEKI